VVDRSDLAVVCSACAMCEHTLICHLLCLMPVIVKVPAMPDDAGSQRTPIQDVSMCPTIRQFNQLTPLVSAMMHFKHDKSCQG